MKPQDKPSCGVFIAGASISINAPIKVVWDILTDFSKYPEWNPFIREQLMTDSTFKALPYQSRHASEYMQMTVHFPPNMRVEEGVRPHTSVEHITLMDDKNYRCEWDVAGTLSWFLSAHRYQQLSETEPGITLYETQEIFGGILAYGVKWTVGADMLNNCFSAMASALKDTAEAKFKA